MIDLLRDPVVPVLLLFVAIATGAVLYDLRNRRRENQERAVASERFRRNLEQSGEEAKPRKAPPREAKPKEEGDTIDETADEPAAAGEATTPLRSMPIGLGSESSVATAVDKTKGR